MTVFSQENQQQKSKRRQTQSTFQAKSGTGCIIPWGSQVQLLCHPRIWALVNRHQADGAKNIQKSHRNYGAWVRKSGPLPKGLESFVEQAAGASGGALRKHCQCNWRNGWFFEETWSSVRVNFFGMVKCWVAVTIEPKSWYGHSKGGQSTKCLSDPSSQVGFDWRISQNERLQLLGKGKIEK